MIKKQKGLIVSQSKGFTIIELIVVIAIIAVLSGIVVSNVNKYQAKARDTRRIADLNQLEKALLLYAADSGAYPSGTYHSCKDGGNWSALETTLKPYISKLPVDPLHEKSVCGSGSYKYYYYYISSYTSAWGWSGNGLCDNKPIIVGTTAESNGVRQNDCGFSWAFSILLR